MPKPVTAEHKPVKRAWLRWGIALLLPLLVSSGIVASLRGAWQTVRLLVRQRRSAQLVQVPQDWQGLILKITATLTEFFFPARPTGLAEWWDEHVLKIDLSKWGQA